MPSLKHSVATQKNDPASRLSAVDPKSEEAFRLVNTLYQALVSAESSERSLRDVTNPDLVEFFRSVQKQQLRIAHQARSMLVEMKHAGSRMLDGNHRPGLVG